MASSLVKTSATQGWREPRTQKPSPPRAEYSRTIMSSWRASPSSQPHSNTSAMKSSSTNIWSIPMWLSSTGNVGPRGASQSQRA